jgi:hypothetical protein
MWLHGCKIQFWRLHIYVRSKVSPRGYCNCLHIGYNSPVKWVVDIFGSYGCVLNCMKVQVSTTNL